MLPFSEVGIKVAKRHMVDIFVISSRSSPRCVRAKWCWMWSLAALLTLTSTGPHPSAPPPLSESLHLLPLLTVTQLYFHFFQDGTRMGSKCASPATPLVFNLVTV